MDDPLRQREARAYNRARRRLGLVSAIVSLAVVVVAVGVAGPLGGWWALLILGPGAWLVGLPLGFAGYRLARRHGLSRQSPRGWLADRAKAGAIGAVLGGLVAAGLLGLQRAAPDLWPLPAWAAAVGLGALLAVVWPVVLLPLFLKSEPLAEGRLADELWRTARAAGVAVRELRLLHMGEKTSAANAMVAGLGPTLRIYVGDTLAEDRGEAEDEALARTRVVLAHELGHHAHGDPWRLLGLSAVTTAVGIAGAWAGVVLLAPDGAGHVSALPAAALGYGLASAVISPLAAAYSRRRERAADRYAVDLTGEGETYARAFERLVEQNLAELDPPRVYHLLTGSHPAPRERIEAARGRQD
jgi:Zn-dependent protease with chaperone function